ncbi:MAG TPA: hypothetical protein VH703_02735 [Solirubrobacterales bacterium]|jgi:hypothetical protein
MAPWKLPLIVLAIAVPIAVAFALGGPGVGLPVGALAAAALLVVAARQRPRGPIGSAPAGDDRRRVLLVVTCAVEDPGAVAEIAAAAELGMERDEAEVLVLSPARIGFLDRWATDLESARRAAQENLVGTVAALAKAGIAAEARVGDEDPVLAVEDQLQSFAADQVVLVDDGAGEADDAAVELEGRLRAGFHRVSLRDGG